MVFNHQACPHTRCTTICITWYSQNSKPTLFLIFHLPGTSRQYFQVLFATLKLMTEHFGNTKVRLNAGNEEKSSAASGSVLIFQKSWTVLAYITPRVAHYPLTHTWGWPNPLHLIYDLSFLSTGNLIGKKHPYSFMYIDENTPIV